MTRKVAALYDSRGEAEVARARLVSEIKAKSPRILSRETVGAVKGLEMAPADVKAYQEGLRAGAHLLVAEVPEGTSPKRIIAILEQSMAQDSDEDRMPGGIDRGVHVQQPADEPSQLAGASASRDEEPRIGRRPSEWPPQPPEEPVRRSAAEATSAPAPIVEEARIPVVEEELRIGKRQVARGGARVRSFTREAPVEERVSLSDEVIDIDRRASERRLSDRDVEEAGLFTERSFEITEMREEPVLSKVAVVREEIIVRKTVQERQETVRDTVRYTEVDIEDLAKEQEPSGMPPVEPRRR